MAQPWAFFLTPFRGWEFAIGGAAGFASSHWLEQHTRAVKAGGWIGAIAIGSAATLFNQHTAFPGTAALLPAAGAALLLLAGAAAPATALPRALSTPGLLYLGRVSYSWYLWHWPVLLFAQSIFMHPSHGIIVAAVVISLALASATNLLVENPARYSVALRPHPALSLGLAAIVMLLIVGCSGFGYWSASRAANGKDQRALTMAHDDVPPLYDSRCIATATQATVHPAGCVFGDASGSRTVVLLGDSHAVQWYPALNRIAHERHWRLLVLTKTSCPATTVSVYNEQLGRNYAECDVWRRAALDTIVARRPAAVFVASSAGYVTPLRYVTLEAWKAGLQATLAKLDSAGIPTLLFRDSPRPGFDIPTCLARAVWRGRNGATSCAVARKDALQRAFLDLDRSTVAGFKNAVLLDLSNGICSAQVCEPIRDGTVVYRDTNHLTASFVSRLVPMLEAQLTMLPTGSGTERHQGGGAASHNQTALAN